MLIFSKVLLLTTVLILSLRLSNYLRHTLLIRIVALTLAALLGYLVVFPEISTRIAHAFGIGRGVDFLFYIGHVLEAFLLLSLYARLRELDRRQTELARRWTLESAEVTPHNASAR